MLRIPKVKNVDKRKNRLTPVKLESKKQDKKVLASRVGPGWDVPNERQEEATSHLLFCFRKSYKIKHICYSYFQLYSSNKKKMICFKL